MSDQQVSIRIRPNGMVEEVKEVVLRSTTMRHFCDEIGKMSSNGMITPILPRGTISYHKNQTARDTVEHVTMMFPSVTRTIAFRTMQRERDGESAVRSYTIAMPHMLVRQKFVNGRIQEMAVGVVKKTPEHFQESVYHLVMPNVFEVGTVCITLEGTPGDIVSTCEQNIDLFFGQSPFSDDLRRWPNGVSGFDDWQAKTERNPRFIEDIEWPYMCKLKRFVSGKLHDGDD